MPPSTGEAHVAVVQLFAHRHCEDHAEPADEILFVIAIEDDRMDHADRRGARIEVQAHDERKPLAIRALVDALESHHRAHRAALLDGRALDFAAEGSAAIERAEQRSIASHGAAIDRERFDDCRSGAGQPRL
jgi:hypothetical protein